MTELLDRIAKFLSAHVEHERGWVAPSEADFTEFWEICTAIRDAKWDRDEDNDPTIEIDLVDRSKGRRPWTPLLPYDYYDKPLEDKHLQAAESALDAAESLSKHARLILMKVRLEKSGKR